MKKDQKRFWSPDCQMAFDKLKRAERTSASVTRLFSRYTPMPQIEPGTCSRRASGSIRKPKAKQNREEKSIPVQEKEKR